MQIKSNYSTSKYQYFEFLYQNGYCDKLYHVMAIRVLKPDSESESCKISQVRMIKNLTAHISDLRIANSSVYRPNFAKIV